MTALGARDSVPGGLIAQFQSRSNPPSMRQDCRGLRLERAELTSILIQRLELRQG